MLETARLFAVGKFETISGAEKHVRREHARWPFSLRGKKPGQEEQKGKMASGHSDLED